MPSSKPRYKEVAEPAISANQLAQYLTASPIARKRIIQSARWQSTAVVARYQPARKALTSILCDAAQSASTLAGQKAELSKRLEDEPGSAWKKADIEASIEALDRHAATANQTGISKLSCQPVHGSVPSLHIGGTRVKVTPDVTIHGTHKGEGKAPVGAMVTMIAKGEGSSNKRKDQAKTAATLVWLFANEHMNGVGTPDRKLCYSYDVFDGALVNAGASIANRLKNIEAAYEEIASAWDKAAPPDDLDD